MLLQRKQLKLINNVLTRLRRGMSAVSPERPELEGRRRCGLSY